MLFLILHYSYSCQFVCHLFESVRLIRLPFFCLHWSNLYKKWQLDFFLFEYVFSTPVVFLLAALASDYIKRLRYCEYLGRYFCQCCHENAQAIVPGRVLRKWDFSKYYVSNFARDLLSKISGDPLFNPSDINNGLYKKIKSLESVRVSSEAVTFSMLMFTKIHGLHSAKGDISSPHKHPRGRNIKFLKSEIANL